MKLMIWKLFWKCSFVVPVSVLHIYQRSLTFSLGYSTLFSNFVEYKVSWRYRAVLFAKNGSFLRDFHYSEKKMDFFKKSQKSKVAVNSARKRKIQRCSWIFGEENFEERLHLEYFLGNMTVSSTSDTSSSSLFKSEEMVLQPNSSDGRRLGNELESRLKWDSFRFVVRRRCWIHECIFLQWKLKMNRNVMSEAFVKRALLMWRTLEGVVDHFCTRKTYEKSSKMVYESGWRCIFSACERGASHREGVGQYLGNFDWAIIIFKNFWSKWCALGKQIVLRWKEKSRGRVLLVKSTCTRTRQRAR